MIQISGLTLPFAIICHDGINMDQHNTNNPSVGSFDFWKAQGRRIHRGAKAISFNNSLPIFHISQTYKPQEVNWNLSRALGNVSYSGDDMPH